LISFMGLVILSQLSRDLALCAVSHGSNITQLRGRVTLADWRGTWRYRAE
jgi:hypothetical protein